MGRYAVTKICWRVANEPEFRLSLKVDPDAALRAAIPPLTDGERQAFLDGAVDELSAMGVHHFLLQSLASNRLFGLDRTSYLERLSGSGPAKT